VTLKQKLEQGLRIKRKDLNLQRRRMKQENEKRTKEQKKDHNVELHQQRDSNHLKNLIPRSFPHEFPFFPSNFFYSNELEL